MNMMIVQTQSPELIKKQGIGTVSLESWNSLKVKQFGSLSVSGQPIFAQTSSRQPLYAGILDLFHTDGVIFIETMSLEHVYAGILNLFHTDGVIFIETMSLERGKLTQALL